MSGSHKCAPHLGRCLAPRGRSGPLAGGFVANPAPSAAIATNPAPRAEDSPLRARTAPVPGGRANGVRPTSLPMARRGDGSQAAPETPAANPYVPALLDGRRPGVPPSPAPALTHALAAPPSPAPPTTHVLRRPSPAPG